MEQTRLDQELEAALDAMPVVVLVRGDLTDVLAQLLPRLQASAIRLFEVTLNSPHAFGTIRTLAEQYRGMIIGAGTVTSVDQVAHAVENGARFLVCPHTDLAIISAAHQQNVPIIPGALTPSEILTAYHAGADFVKLFPATLLGPEYIRQLRGPLPQVPLIATGGVTPNNAADFLKAGARGVALGSALINPRLRDADGIEWFERQLQVLVASIQRNV